MNPMLPPVTPIDPYPLLASGYLMLLFALAVACAMAIFGAMIWSIRRATWERANIRCPTRLRTVRVVFGLGPKGERTDVVRCSVFGRRRVACDKICLAPRYGSGAALRPSF